MKPKYAELGFKIPNYLENEYGIRIYLGTTESNNWHVSIPKELIGGNYEKYCDEDFTFYMISEEYALSVASRYTRYAREEERKAIRNETTVL